MIGGDDDSGVTRSVDLPGSRRLVVRFTRPDDVEGLCHLFETLSEDDLYRRFFQAHMPGLRALQAMASAAQRGGVGLVAEVRQPGCDPTIVGEATAERVSNSNGEMAITVTPRWRGWLGPYLLDALVEAAAARGMPNLEADILFDNRPMFALVRARGFVTLGHYDGPSIVRVAIGAAGRFPTWPAPHEHPRVVVEIPGGRWHAESAARAAGFEVVVCPGPRRGTSYCAPMRGAPCPLASSADVIVTEVPADDDLDRLLESHRTLHRGVPVCVEPPPGLGRRGAGDGRGALNDADAVAMLRRAATGEPAVSASRARP